MNFTICLTFQKIIFLIKVQMMDEEEQPLNPQQNKSVKLIRSERLKKQLQFIQSYEYDIKNEDQFTIINFKNVWPTHFEFNELKLFIPQQYPFKEPQYQYETLTSPLPVSQIIQFWSPKYKVTQLLELIIRRTQQQVEFEKVVENNYLYQGFKPIRSLILLVVIAIFIRILVGLGSYSGKGDWPNLGDFQAHRNWMAITVNRPISEWYTQINDEPWWRIDYPPIAAYLSLFFGEIYRKIEPQALLPQEGYESQSLTAFMRFSVILIDSLFYIPSIVLMSLYLFEQREHKNRTLQMMGIMIILLKPDIILIDHGHFQYNSIALGLIIYSIYFMLNGNRYICCFLFSFALNCKQMTTYYALGFPCALIGLSLHKNKGRRHKVIKEIIIFAMIVISTFFVVWLPWLTSMELFKTVIQAIFPIHRGLYQLKVSNFWCISDPFFKWQRLLSKETLMALCGFLCFCLSWPAMIAMVVKPTRKIILIGFATISMTFFLFSYHVHEKSILLPLAIIPFLVPYLGKYFVLEMVLTGCFGMYHLLVEDGQTLQYFVCIVLFLLFSLPYYSADDNFLTITKQNNRRSLKIEKIHFSLHEKPFILAFTVMAMLFLHVCKHLIAPPESLPYLYNYLFAFFGFVYNVYMLMLGNMIILQTIEESIKRSKKE